MPFEQLCTCIKEEFPDLADEWSDEFQDLKDEVIKVDSAELAKESRTPAGAVRGVPHPELHPEVPHSASGSDSSKAPHPEEVPEGGHRGAATTTGEE